METPAPKIVPVVYSDEEKRHRAALIQRLCDMREERDRSHPELDDMSWVEYYDANRRKDLSYIPPKKNKHDVRIVTGTTREKDTTLLTTLLNLNLEPDITAFDEDDMLVAELGDNMTDMIEKSRRMEVYEKKRPILYREMIAQGDVFVEELWIEDFKKMPLEKLTWDPLKDGVSKLSFNERLKRIHAGCAVRMVQHPKVYLGSMRTEYIEDQGVVAILNMYPRSIAETMYGKWERWKHVPKAVDVVDFTADAATYKDWSLVAVNDDQVAEIKIFDKSANRFMIMLNGVMMLPINYPLSAISPNGEIPMAQGKLEPISGFALSKSQPSKTKVDQEVLDEVTMLMVEKTRQSFKPPMGNASKRVYSDNIFVAGTITNDIKTQTLFPLLPDRSLGVTAPEFNFYNTIKESINEKTTNEVYSGDSPQGNPTATEVLELKEQQMLKLGLAVDGAVNFERRLAYLRLHNIIQNWTKPVDYRIDDVRGGVQHVFRHFSADTTLPNGETGTKVFRFTTDEYPDTFDQMSEAERLSESQGRPVRIVYMNPELLATIHHTWYIRINPTPRSSDRLSQLILVQNLTQAAQLFGLQSLNIEYLKQRFAMAINEDYTRFFVKVPLEQMLAMQVQPPASVDPKTKGGGQQPPMSPGAVASGQPLRPAIVQ